MYLWIMRINHNEITAIGPYQTEEAAENRLRKSVGGESHIFRSSSNDARSAIDEFKADIMAGRV